MSLELMYITNNPSVAMVAEKYNVNRIWIDLEQLGKAQRQGHIDSVKSYHSIEDIYRVASVLKQSKLMVRINPWNEGSLQEIEQVIAAGAQIVMLPMWKSATEVQNFISAVAGRAQVSLLLETKEAQECLDDVLRLKGIDEIHIGLNDLHLSYGMSFMFELLADGTVEEICKKIKRAGLPYGFGGIAKIGEGKLPAEHIIMEHYRLGSSRVILSRSFCNTEEVSNIEEIEEIFCSNMLALRNFEAKVVKMEDAEFEANRQNVRKIVDEIVRNIYVF